MDQHLWTPWRMSYIKGEKKDPEGCIFCHKATADDAEELVIHRGTLVYVTLNRYPYNNGHVMAVPYKHVASQEELSPDCLLEMMVTINQAMAVIREASNPAGFNLGANIGKTAGAGIADHYHFHVVPRWQGDSNFMSTVGSTRVIPETLDKTYEVLKKLWQTRYGG